MFKVIKQRGFVNVRQSFSETTLKNLFRLQNAHSMLITQRLHLYKKETKGF